MVEWTINTNVTMIGIIFLFLFVGNMIIFVITNPTYIRDRNSDEIDVGKLLLATLIASTFGVVIIWLISVLIRSPRSGQGGSSGRGESNGDNKVNNTDQAPNIAGASVLVHTEQADAVRTLSEY
jgi:hypothetical protein